MSRTFISSFTRALAALAAGSSLLLAGCERPPMQTTQQGFRGTAMQNTVNPRIAEAQRAAVPAVPQDAPPAGNDGPKAKDVYQNVKVLGHLPLVEFNRHMNAITQWISPVEGCTYCHTANFAEDTKYTKVVARRMIEMTQGLNGTWKQHTGATGVTCYTCHRGNKVPENVWTSPAVSKMNTNTMIGNDFGQNKAAKHIGSTSLPYDPFSSYLAGDEAIGVSGKDPLPTNGRGKGATIQQAEKTYALMIHTTKALGVNCTFCHNSQAFSQWTPRKVAAWHGIRMARDINNNYLTPLTASFPANRLGPNGDVLKATCATCHQGVNKPLGGLEMAKLYPGLQPLPEAVVAAAAPPAAGPAPAKAP
jgi:photosynthetic reaction center cytochrome c subunit